jgi:hypothetical protein
MAVNRNLPYMYLVPKVHKMLKPEDVLTARTITPAHRWITAAASKYIAHLLNVQLEKACPAAEGLYRTHTNCGWHASEIETAGW